MSLIQIPLQSTYNKLDFSIDLSGATYRFTFTWNARIATWVFDLYDNANNQLMSGVPFLLGVDYLARSASTSVPPGILFALDTSNAGIEAGRSDLGDRVILLYEDLQN